MSSGPGKFMRSTQAWFNKLSRGVLSTVLLSCLLQKSPASAATTTILGIDLGMHEESIDTGRQILTTLLKQADNETSFGLVLADELVQTVIDPTSAQDLLEVLPELTLAPGDSGNFSTLLERSLAMADEAMASKAHTDTVNLWVISGGEIKLSGETDNTSKKTRFQVWASDILLPDIAERYPDFRIITPQQNSPEMIDAVTLYFGQTAHRLLPETKNDVQPFIGSLISDGLTVATNPASGDTHSSPKSTASPNDLVASNTDVDKVKSVQSISEQHDSVPDINTLPDADNKLAENQQRPAINPANNQLIIENDIPLATAVNENTAQLISDAPLNANADRQAAPLKVEQQIATDSSTDKVDLEVTDLQVIASTDESSGMNKSRATFMIAMLGATGVLTLAVVAMFRRKRPLSTAAKSTPLTPPESIDHIANTVINAKQLPADKSASTREMIDIDAETAIAPPTTFADAATVVAQATATDETVVNQRTPQSGTNPSENEEIDFSAFDRSIIEKRWAQLEDENPASPKKS